MVINLYHQFTSDVFVASLYCIGYQITIATKSIVIMTLIHKIVNPWVITITNAHLMSIDDLFSLVNHSSNFFPRLIKKKERDEDIIMHGHS